METTVITPVPCPAPFSVTLDAATPYIVAADFNAAQLANHQEALNYNGTNKGYAHTFVWKPNTCCCVATSAVLTVRMKSLTGGTSSSTPDAGNDGISVVGFGGLVLAPFSGPIYGPAFPFPAGTLATKTWTLSGSALNKLNTEHTVSVYLQDDTSVLSATLVISGCCLSK